MKIGRERANAYKVAYESASNLQERTRRENTIQVVEHQERVQQEEKVQLEITSTCCKKRKELMGGAEPLPNQSTRQEELNPIFMRQFQVSKMSEKMRR